MCVITRVVSVGEADVTTEADLDADGVFWHDFRAICADLLDKAIPPGLGIPAAPEAPKEDGL